MPTARTFLTKCSEAALGLALPPRCALCGVLGREALCSDCRATLEPNPYDPTVRGDLDFSLPIYAYDGKAAQAVLALKYYRRTELAEPMAGILCEFVGDYPWLEGFVAVPVPIHWTRKAIRGFNQADLLAESLPNVRTWAKRIRATQPQVRLKGAERTRNLEGAFLADPRASGQNILLIDDVVTTGHTAQACAKAFRQVGALSVGIIAFAGNP